MRGLLTVSLVVGLVSLPVSAQRAMPSVHIGGGFSASRGFSAPRMSGGFGAGLHFASPPTHFASPPSFAPRNYGLSPQTRWSMPSRYAGVTPYRAPYNRWHNPAPDWRHGHRPPYWGRGNRYRVPYVPYFYANSTYLVPGLLNSWWDYPYDDFGIEDESSYSNTQNNYAQGPPSDYSNENEQEQQPANNGENVPPPPPPAAPQEPLKLAAVTLVFKDGHTQQVSNYALTSTTLYVLDDASSGRRPEIPLESIDVAATQRANHQAGVDFTLPGPAN